LNVVAAHHEAECGRDVEDQTEFYRSTDPSVDRAAVGERPVFTDEVVGERTSVELGVSVGRVTAIGHEDDPQEIGEPVIAGPVQPVVL
jgi:hypothetical protein